MKIGINGFGRIGRQVFRIAFEQQGLEVVHINDVTELETLAALLQFDASFGRFAHRVRAEGPSLHVDGRTIAVSAEREPAKLPWRDKGVDVVLESTGVFRKKEDAAKHLAGGAKKALVSAPGKIPLDGDFVIGVNDTLYDRARHHVISIGSCTTHCLAPIAKVTVVGTDGATRALKDGEEVTISCAEGTEGRIYRGALKYEERDIDLDKLPKPSVRLMINLAAPDAALRWWRLPVRGVGLARMEFLINDVIKIHPLALARFAAGEARGASCRPDPGRASRTGGARARTGRPGFTTRGDMDERQPRPSPPLGDNDEDSHLRSRELGGRCLRVAGSAARAPVLQ